MSTQGQAVDKEAVLVVEDESTIRTMLHRFLTRAGYAVHTAPTADDALSLCRAQPFALVLTDLKMPGMSGTEFVRQLRLLSPAPEVVVMTGYPTLESAIQTLRAGVYDYILKPFNLEALQSVVARCLEHRRLRGELASERQLRRDLEEANLVNARLRSEAEQNARDLRRLSMELRHTQETERQRIARDLHDGVVQTLSLISIRLDLLEHSSEEAIRGSTPPLPQTLKELGTLLAQTLDEMRNLIWTLRPRALDDLGLADALTQLVAHNSVVSTLAIALEVDKSLPSLSAAVTTALYRISQEALANVIQHADATEAKVRLEYSDDVVHLSISDNGRGYEVTSPAQPPLPTPPGSPPFHRGLGLWSMRERAVEVGGTLAITTAPGQGTMIVVEIPT